MDGVNPCGGCGHLTPHRAGGIGVCESEDCGCDGPESDLAKEMRAARLRQLQEYGFVKVQADWLKGDSSARENLLDEAKRLICSDRNATYGPPSQDFERTARIWSEMFGREFTAHEVAMAMIALKLSRLVWRPEHQDSWTDIAGYAACGHECVEEGK